MQRNSRSSSSAKDEVRPSEMIICHSFIHSFKPVPAIPLLFQFLPPSYFGPWDRHYRKDWRAKSFPCLVPSTTSTTVHCWFGQSSNYSIYHIMSIINLLHLFFFLSSPGALRIAQTFELHQNESFRCSSLNAICPLFLLFFATTCDDCFWWSSSIRTVKSSTEILQSIKWPISIPLSSLLLDYSNTAPGILNLIRFDQQTNQRVLNLAAR